MAFYKNQTPVQDLQGGGKNQIVIFSKYSSQGWIENKNSVWECVVCESCP